MSLPEPILILLRAPVEVRDFHLRRDGSDWVLTVATPEQRVRLVNPHPLDVAWSLFMDDPSEVRIADIRSRQLESHGVEVSTVNGEGLQICFLAKSADQAAAT
jgi:hypothetical protein